MRDAFLRLYKRVESNSSLPNHHWKNSVLLNFYIKYRTLVAGFEMSNQTANQIFSSDDEAGYQQQLKKPKDSKASSSSLTAKRSAVGESMNTEIKKKKKNKTTINPISASTRPTLHDLFGTDSDDEQEEETVGSTSGKKIPPLHSYYTRRVANSISKQIDENKKGKFYVEVKIYDHSERIAPINRWRHAIVTVKNRTNDGTLAWNHMKNFLKETHREFKHCPIDYVSSYFL
ncbi:unnamed protein product [Arctia plantaginis]|uniref:Uncharacterized protein n=1 Tax=Arctia plantaginis TaxID=874455 RepID=A0A8S1B7P3_ARCPL|nr:unnamed protein product [Arctia plantaginis]